MQNKPPFKSRIPYLTKQQLRLVKKELPYPYNMFASVMMTEFIRFMNRDIFGTDVNDKDAVLHDHIPKYWVNDLIKNDNIKGIISKIKERDE